MHGNYEEDREKAEGWKTPNSEPRPTTAGAILPGWHSEKLATPVMLFLIVYAAFRSIAVAASTPFWYDELCTLAVAQQNTISGIVRALRESRDGNPPLYYMVEHAFTLTSANQHVAYRLASILGFCCALWCTFVFVRRRSGGSAAVLCASLLLLTPLSTLYATESRPYGLVVGCIALALVCYQRALHLGWMVVMGLSLAFAEGCHYYAVFSFVPFGVAELAFILREKRWRWSVWVALAVGCVPLAMSLPMLLAIRKAYGQHVWAQPILFGTANLYGRTLDRYAIIVIASAILLGTMAIGLMVMPRFRPIFRWAAEAARNEYALVLGFLAIPVTAFIATRLTHGAFTMRYALPAILALPLAADRALRLLDRRAIALLALAIVLAAAASESALWHAVGGPFRPFESPAVPAENLVELAGHSDLPVVISDGQEYVQAAYYASAEWRNRFVGIVDPPEAIVFAGSDSLDRQMPALQCCLPVNIREFSTFSSANPEFLLYSNGGSWDWWPARLVRDGYALRLVAVQGNRKVYLVGRGPDSP